MKRLHVHVNVEDLASAIRFYTTLFGTGPCMIKDDFAKWILEDPLVYFAISKSGRAAGLAHLGIQMQTVDELTQVAGRLRAAGEITREERVGTTYKTWVDDPSGLIWETFFPSADPSVVSVSR